MDRQLVIRPHGDLFHVAFHNYMGPYEGHQIGETLGLQEIEPPEEDVGAEPLREGQYYLWHAMDRHPDLHALVGPERLGDVARAIDQFHVRVLKGRRYLPERKRRRKVAPPPGYTAFIEEEHKPFWARGPRAILQAFVMGALPTAIVLFGVLIVFRHMADHRQDVGFDEVFRRASLPAVEQTAFQRFWNPDHSGELRTTLGAICYIDGEQVVLSDGQVIEFAGLRDVRPVMERARVAGVPPKLEVNVVDGKARVEAIRIGNRVVGSGIELRRITRLPRSTRPPDRTRVAGSTGWFQPDRLPLGDTPEMRALKGQQLCLRGTLHKGERGLELHCLGGEVFLLDLARETKGMEEFLNLFADGDTDVRADVVLEEVFRTSEQEETGVIGRAALHSASVQSYHIVAAR